jgi:hypothetical protein
MILRTWTENVDGVVLESNEHNVGSKVEATALLVAELYDTASDEFFEVAVKEWVTTGEIVRLSEDVNDTAFWNAQVIA